MKFLQIFYTTTIDANYTSNSSSDDERDEGQPSFPEVGSASFTGPPEQINEIEG